MLPSQLKFSFEKFRRELLPSTRFDLDSLSVKLNLLKGPEVVGGDYLTCFTKVLRFAAPTFSREQCKALAFYALCVRCDSSVWQSLNPLASGIVQSGTTNSGTTSSRGSSGSSSNNLISTTQQAQETQMSFNLQYLMLQENSQYEARQFTCLSSIMKARSASVKSILLNLR